MPGESVRPKFLLIDGDDLVLGECLDAEGLFVESRDDDEPVTIELLGCLPVQRMRDYLSGSKRYRRRNPLGLEGLRMLDAAGEPLVDLWLSQIIDCRPSALGSERVDLVGEWGYDSPLACARDVWERWLTARPDRPNLWAGYEGAAREEWLTLVRRDRRAPTDRPDRSPGRTYDLDGSHITDKAGFYLAIGEAINGPGGYFGCNLDALNDCLRGRFGAQTPFTLIWHDSHIARESLATPMERPDGHSTYFDVIQDIFREHGVDVTLRR
ncbi:barstar family protein [Microtetraspora sp. NBRC 13810]|uniref:barstar family protein n=1 Tax=Microtetraspora sp. NBRC 13810 TaxID=3030990 RepID=UPI0025569923|nr:barstar family protein [Microtetraspora sp. NBRC 13810]